MPAAIVTTIIAQHGDNLPNIALAYLMACREGKATVHDAKPLYEAYGHLRNARRCGKPINVTSPSAMKAPVSKLARFGQLGVLGRRVPKAFIDALHERERWAGNHYENLYAAVRTKLNELA